MLQNVLIVKLANLYTVNLYVFLFSFVHAPVCAIFIQKKKKKKKKMTHTSVWLKYQIYATNAPLSIFFSWEREGILTPQTL